MAEIYSRPSVIREKIENGYSFSPGKVVSDAWEIFKKEPGLFIGYSLLIGVISSVLSFIPIVGQLASLAVSPALATGYLLVAHEIEKGRKPDFNTFFKSFDKFGELFLVYLVAVILTGIGMIFLVIPGIYLAVCFFPLLYGLVWYHYNGSLGDTLETMRKLVTKNWGQFFVTGLAAVGVIMLGVLALFVGLLIAIPVVGIMYYTVYREVIGFEEEEDSPEDHLILSDEE